MAFSSPNHTQTPNDLFDEHMANMGEAELKVVLCAVRQTLGWHVDRTELSVSFLMKKTGLCRQSVLDGIEKATARGLIKEVGKGKRGVRVFGLVIESDQSKNQNSTGLESRPDSAATGLESRNIKEKETKQTPRKKPDAAPTHSKALDEFNATLSRKVVGQIKPDKKSKTEKSYADVDPKVRVAIIEAWAKNLPAVPVGAYKRDDNHEEAAEIHRSGYTAENVADYVKYAMSDPFWNGKTLTLRKVGELMPNWLKSRKVVPPPVYGSQPIDYAKELPPEADDWSATRWLRPTQESA